MNWPKPRGSKDICAFLTSCSYYRRFIPKFITRASPLNRLLEAGQVIEWTPECQSAWKDLNLYLTGDELMSYPDDKGIFILDTDASNPGIGATLSQLQWSERVQKEVERPISYARKSLTKSQR